MRKTEKYQLPQWDKEDRIMMEDFNEAMSNIEDGIEEAKSEAKSTTDALAKDLGSGGKTSRIAWGSYVGTGKIGSSDPNTVTVDFRPMVVFVCREGDTDHIVAWRPLTRIYISNHTGVTAAWGDRSVSWYANHPVDQLNIDGYTYHWVILGENS